MELIPLHRESADDRISDCPSERGEGRCCMTSNLSATFLKTIAGQRIKQTGFVVNSRSAFDVRKGGSDVVGPEVIFLTGFDYVALGQRPPPGE